MKKRICIAVMLLMVAGFVLVSQNTTRRKVKPLPPPTSIITEEKRPGESPDTISDAARIATMLELYGYTKTVSSRQEAFLARNLTTTDTITSITVNLDYRDSEGNQLNRRDIPLKCNIPPGETRYLSFDAWDRQQQFFYRSTPPARENDRVRPFDVSIRINTIVTAAKY